MTMNFTMLTVTHTRARAIRNCFLFEHDYHLDVDHYTNGIQRDLMRHWNNLTRQQFGR